MIYEHFRAIGAYEAVHGLSDLFNIRLQDDVTSILRSGLIAGRRKERGTTNRLLHTSQSVRGQSGRRRTQR